MKSIANKVLQMRRRLVSAGDAVRQRARATVVRLRSLVPGATVSPAPAPARRENWWQIWVRNPAAPPATATTEPLATPRHRPWYWRAARYAVLTVMALILLPYIVVPLYAIVNPPISALMARQAIYGKTIRHEWVAFDDISPHLVRAVLLAEDASFCRHSGVDWSAISEALDAVEEGETPRGASTIPMQTAKNLFLWNHQDYLRKGLELPLAYYMSLVLSKRRVAEIYLNVAEWGPGVFGAEAAAQHHFGKSAAELTSGEASLLAAALPSPLKRRAGRPSVKLLRLANHVEERMDREARDVNCVFE
jgi:monofunctional glycosyltransferase